MLVGDLAVVEPGNGGVEGDDDRAGPDPDIVADADRTTPFLALGAAGDIARPILFFDSGVGGLSVVAPTRELLPTAPIVYAADSAGFPYGTRSEAEIAARVPALLGRLVERYRPRLVVIACNTASAAVLRDARERYTRGYNIPVTEVIQPAVRRAVARCGLPAGVFQLLIGERAVGTALVADPRVKAVGFTGSLTGGRALFDLCAGFVYSQVLLACVRLRLCEVLRAEGAKQAAILREAHSVPLAAHVRKRCTLAFARRAARRLTGLSDPEALAG